MSTGRHLFHEHQRHSRVSSFSEDGISIDARSDAGDEDVTEDMCASIREYWLNPKFEIQDELRESECGVNRQTSRAEHSSACQKLRLCWVVTKSRCPPHLDVWTQTSILTFEERILDLISEIEQILDLSRTCRAVDAHARHVLFNAVARVCGRPQHSFAMCEDLDALTDDSLSDCDSERETSRDTNPMSTSYHGSDRQRMMSLDESAGPSKSRTMARARASISVNLSSPLRDLRKKSFIRLISQSPLKVSPKRVQVEASVIPAQKEKEKEAQPATPTRPLVPVMTANDLEFLAPTWDPHALFERMKTTLRVRPRDTKYIPVRFFHSKQKTRIFQRTPAGRHPITMKVQDPCSLSDWSGGNFCWASKTAWRNVREHFRFCEETLVQRINEDIDPAKGSNWTSVKKLLHEEFNLDEFRKKRPLSGIRVNQMGDTENQVADSGACPENIDMEPESCASLGEDQNELPPPILADCVSVRSHSECTRSGVADDFCDALPRLLEVEFEQIRTQIFRGESNGFRTAPDMRFDLYRFLEDEDAEVLVAWNLKPNWIRQENEIVPEVCTLIGNAAISIRCPIEIKVGDFLTPLDQQYPYAPVSKLAAGTRRLESGLDL